MHQKRLKVSSIIRARCPACHVGKVLNGGVSLRPRCPHCNYNFYPEPGFYVGSMAISFLITAILIIPPMIVLKYLNVDTTTLVIFPFIEFIFVGSFLLFYCRIIWLHLEFQLTDRLDGQETRKKSKKD